MNDNDIAIIGMALRFPGARNPVEFWRNLRDGVEAVEHYGEQELIERGVSQDLLSNPHYVRSGTSIEAMEWFDPEFFGFSPKEAGILDPQHRQFYECAWEALERAGHPPETFDGAIGVFAGCGMGAYFIFNLLSNPELVDSVGLFLLRHTGNDKDFLTTRISYCFDLKGPSINVQTACSTSLVATHLACQSLLGGECDMALAGGVTIEAPHRVGYLYQEGEILSPDGHCRAFDHRSQGTIFGSGAGVIVLRRLADALADGDHIHAVIKGTAVNNDGSGKVGYLAPSVEGQAAAVAEALAVADVAADSIGYVECHGTGTPVGDPIEIAALTRAFRNSTDRTGYCGVGSVKTNIGHLDTAAGVASVIKVALALEHSQIPPSLNFEAPNPSIDFAASPFQVNHTLRDWVRAGGPRRAGVNSLGVGGTNAFGILEEAPARPAASPALRRHQLFVLSARNRKALDAAGQRLAAHLRDHRDRSLADIAYTLFVGRRAFEQRRVLACSSPEEAVELLENNDPRRVFTHAAGTQRGSVVFMFPGGGAQYFGMGRDLHAAEPVFKEHLERGLDALKRTTGLDLRPLLFADESERGAVDERFAQPSVQLPAIFMIEYALAQLWISQGISPAALIGHSVGENTAACVAGVMAYEDALGLVHLRGTLMDGVPAGGMLSVQLPAHELERLLGADLDLASINSPTLSVASGPVKALDALAERLLEQGVEAQRVRIRIAAHSRMLEDILQPFGDYLRSIELRPPKIPFVSNRTGAWITAEQATDPDYWVRHLRNTVQFAEGVKTLLEEPGRVFLEVGPGHALGSFVKQNPDAPAQRVFPSLRHPEVQVPDDAHFLTVLGRLWAVGVPVAAETLWPGERRYRVPLPTYAFQGARYWIEPGKAGTGAAKPVGRLKKLADFDAWFHRPVWLQQGVLKAPESRSATWLVFLDAGRVGPQLLERLRRRGQDVITVREGDAYYRISDHEYRLPPELGREGYDALARDLVASGRIPDRILHLWLLTEDESFRPGSSFFHRNQEQGFYSLFFLAQALGDTELGARERHVIVVTNGMQRVRDEALPYPEKATVLGPCKLIPRELSGFSCACVDIALPDPGRSLFGPRRKPEPNGWRELIDALETELFTKPSNGVIAYRDGVRYELRHERAEFEATQPSRIRQGGVYLITGGLGGIGLTMAEYLARSAGAKLVLLGRTPLPERADWQDWLKRHPHDDPIGRAIRNIRRLEQAGAEVLALSADITDVERMREVIDETKATLGPINGVLHAAGVVRDNLMQIKTQAEVEDVFTPKIYGTLVLDRLLDGEDLDFFVLFSSTSTLVAPAGQVDYVAANAFLNAYARSRAGRGGHTVAINWGIWNQVGMAAAAAARMGYGGPAPGRSETPVAQTRHPWLETRFSLLDGERATHVFTAHYSPRTHWVLDEHRTAQGQALLPGTGYIELARAALRECGERGPFAIQDLYFLRPLHVADDEAREVRLKLRRNEQGYGFEVLGRRGLDDGSSGWERHAQARLLLAGMTEPTPLDLPAIDARCQAERSEAHAIRTRQEDHLRFGPRWRVLRRVGYGENEALARLELPELYADDLLEFELHPALLDLATGYAMQLIQGYAESPSAEHLWVPVSYASLRMYRPLTRQIYSWVRSHGENRVSADFASFDASITDARGQVLVEVRELTLKKLTEALDLGLAPQPAQIEPEVERPTATVSELRQISPAERAFQHNLTQGILPAEGAEALSRILAGPPVPEIIVSSLDLDGLLDEAGTAVARAQTAATQFSRPELDSEYLEPRDDIERTLAGFWGDLLGVDRIGIRDNFFDLGGHSLIAVRLFARIKQAYAVDYPISVLFEAPTIEGCAELIRQQTGASDSEKPPADREAPRTRYTHLVPMHPGEGAGRTPFFLVAGMFGNVLNLRHLAHLLGADRPFYGLQARGLYGDHEPHATFEEMARDYIAELRTVQPEGPYFLGGFSGGGITAYEMARQLRAQGQEIALLVLLDTPLPQSPPLSSVDRMSIHWQRLRRKGPAYFTEWARNRYQWEMEKYRKRFEQAVEEQQPFDFQSEKMEIAFRKALDRYALEPQPLRVTLFRPRLDQAYVLRGGRVANQDREIVLHDNGWSPYVEAVAVHEVPGDHDGMVLEPNVRVLAAKLRRCLDEAEVELAPAFSRAM